MKESSRKRHFPPQVLIVAGVFVLACQDSAMQSPTPELRTEAVCDSGVPAYDVFVDHHVSAIGPSANDLAMSDEALWIVESAANTVSRFDRSEHDFQSGFVDVGNDRNPYAIEVDEGAREIWVTNFLADTVTVADLDTGAIRVEISDPAFADPSDVVLSDDYAYVSNVDFISVSEGYGPGTIAIIDRSTWEVVHQRETEFRNPQFLTLHDRQGEPVLYASGSGALRIDDGQVHVVSEGGVEWFELADDPVEPPHRSVPIGQASIQTVGAPGRPLPTPDGQALYFTSGIAPALFKFDLETETWAYDASHPLPLYDTERQATHAAAMGPDGLLWVTAFNRDALYLLDTACDELIAPAIDLGHVADMLEGPQAIAVADDGRSAHYILTIANALGHIQLNE